MGSISIGARGRRRPISISRWARRFEGGVVKAGVVSMVERDTRAALMPPDARRDKQEQFERKRRDAARAADDYQKELEKREGVLLQKVLQEVGGVIEKVGKEKNYYMIVEKRNAGVLYASNDADLTDEVIRAYD